MRVKIIYVLLLTSCYCFSQNNSKIIEMDDYFRYESVVFTEDYKAPFQISDFKKSFTPTESQLKEAEKLLKEQYNLSKRKIVDSLSNAGREGLKYPDEVKNVRKKLCKYRRQYVGYVNKDNDTIISINLLNFKKRRKAEKYFTDWETRYIVGFDGFYYKNMEYFDANLTTDKLEVGNGN